MIVLAASAAVFVVVLTLLVMLALVWEPRQ